MKARGTGFLAFALCIALFAGTPMTEGVAAAARTVNVGDVSADVELVVTDDVHAVKSENLWDKAISAAKKGLEILGGLMGSSGGNSGGGHGGSSGGGSDCKVSIEIKGGTAGGDVNIGNINCGGTQSGDGNSGSKQ